MPAQRWQAQLWTVLCKIIVIVAFFTKKIENTENTENTEKTEKIEKT
jgi:hypothetical protein